MMSSNLIIKKMREKIKSRKIVLKAQLKKMLLLKITTKKNLINYWIRMMKRQMKK